MSEISKLLDGINGAQAPPAAVGDHMHCDSCDEIVYPNSDIALYAANWEILDRFDEGQSFRIFRAYCEDCRRESFLMPMKEAFELMIFCRYNQDKRYEDAEIVAYSVPGDGIDWNPREVVDWFFPEPLELTIAMMGGMDMAPEDVVELLLHYHLDPRQVVDDDGELMDNEETRELRAKAVQEKIDELSDERMGEMLQRMKRMQEYDYSMGGFGGTEEQNQASEERRDK